MPEVRKAVVELIKASENRGLKIKEIADLLEVDERSVWRWFSGERVPTLAMAIRIQKTFGIAVDLWLE